MPSGSYLKQPLHVPARWLLEVTTTFARPKAAPPGVVPVIWVVPITVRPASSVPPIVTLVTSMKLAPVIVMLVPPTIGPVAGLTAVTLIAAGGEAPSLQPAVTGAAKLPTIATSRRRPYAPPSDRCLGRELSR